jgi:hypothetical protein
MNTFVIARMTYREGVKQSLFYLVIAVSAALIFLAPLFTLFAFGQEINMLREVGLATITFAGLLIGIVSAYLLLTSEIEKLTVLTTLSKPLKRSEFIIGKFLGIVYTCTLAMAFLGIVFCLVYWLQEGRAMLQTGLQEGRYLNHPELVTQDVRNFIRYELGLLVKGLYFCLLQVSIINAFAILLASQFNLLLSALGCFMFFLLGHITPYLTQGLINSKNMLVVLFGNFINLLLPNLTNLNVSSLVADSYPVSWYYLLITSCYTMIYVAIILIIASMLFARREIK